MRKKSSLGHAQNVRLRTLIREELLTRIPKQLHLAPLLGMNQGNLSRFLDAKVGVQAAVAMRVAFLLDRPIEDVLGATSAAVLNDEEEARYPSRILAARAAYLDGVPLEQIKAVLSSTLRFEEDPGAQWWLKLMNQKRFAKPGSKYDTTWALKQWDRSQARTKPASSGRSSRTKKT
jgi:hypothetical protein